MLVLLVHVAGLLLAAAVLPAKQPLLASTIEATVVVTVISAAILLVDVVAKLFIAVIEESAVLTLVV